MSMYTQLLGTALESHSSSPKEATSGQALADLLHSRKRLKEASRHGSNWASAVVADELAYDIALIELARLVGVECEVGEFDQPRDGRAHLEERLEFQGMFLGKLGDEIQPGSDR
jgi:hypothetical protein